LRNRVIEWAKKAKIYPSEEIKYEELEVIKTAIDLALQFEEEIKLKE
jgi:hypothetical protein